jgi:methionine synthase I (cobalamin-dependent)
MSLLSRFRLMDGAMATRLFADGLAVGACAAQWNLTRPRAVSRVHVEYLAAGAEVLLSNTFLSDPVSLARDGLGDRLEEINHAAVALARRAPGPPHFVLGDVGPLLSPGRLEFADRDALRRTVASLADADGILFETCSTPAALAAVEFVSHRVGEVDGLPLLLSVTYHRVGGELVTYSGHRPETFARHAARHGVAALGVNCGREIDLPDVIEIVRRYRQETDLPLFARPNAGTPSAGWEYPRTPEAMAARLADLIGAGATMVGGCCGTTPAHVAAFRAAAGR